MLKATWRSLKAHKARMLLSGLAVVLGVAFVVGTFIFTDTLKGTFDELFGGEVPDVVVTQELKVGGDDGTGSVASIVPAEVLEEIRTLPGVKLATGDVQVLGVTLVDANGKALGGNGPPQLGFSFPEFPDEPRVSGVTLVEGRAPTAPEEIVVDVQTAEKAGFAVGDTVTVVTQGPRIEAPLVGLIRYGVTGGLAGATLTMFDREYAQETFVGSDAWNQVSVLTDGSITPEQLRDDVTAAIGAGYEVKTGTEVQDETAEQLGTALGLHQHVPARLRLHRPLRGHVHHPQHVLDAGGPAHQGAGAAAGDRREQGPDHVVRGGRGADPGTGRRCPGCRGRHRCGPGPAVAARDHRGSPAPG